MYFSDKIYGRNFNYFIERRSETVSKMMIAVFKKEIIALFIIIFSARFRFLF